MLEWTLANYPLEFVCWLVMVIGCIIVSSIKEA